MNLNKERKILKSAERKMKKRRKKQANKQVMEEIL